MNQPVSLKKILIIDDNPAVCSMLEHLFKDNHYSTVTVQDGLDGLYKARQEKPDLILLDVILPGMDGFKVCRMIKFDPQLKKIPVVILTSRMTEEDREMGFQCGADGYLMKATSTDSILKEIRKLLDK
jgi:two-component system, OmpR family, alkaline phosphatase synthesis response regulator PhoP